VRIPVVDVHQVNGSVLKMHMCCSLKIATRHCMEQFFFVGAAFVGAAPQLTYRRFLEQLAAKGYIIISVPFETSLDDTKTYMRVALKFERSYSALLRDRSRNHGLDLLSDLLHKLPVWAIGHSFGALSHVLSMCDDGGVINSSGQRRLSGAVLLAYNRRPLGEALPVLRAAVSTNPFLQGVLQMSRGSDTTSSRLQAGAAALLQSGAELTQRLIPGVQGESTQFADMLLQATPLLRQLQPLLRELAEGGGMTGPTSRQLADSVSQRYYCRRTLLIQFKSDATDETPFLACALANGDPNRDCDFTMRRLSGTHLTPLLTWASGTNRLPASVDDLVDAVAGLLGRAETVWGGNVMSPEFAKRRSLKNLSDEAENDFQNLINTIDAFIRNRQV